MTTYINKTTKQFTKSSRVPLYDKVMNGSGDTVLYKDGYGVDEWECLTDAGYKEVTSGAFVDAVRSGKVRETMVGSFVGDDGEDYGIFLVLSGGMNFFTVAGELWSIQPTELMQGYCKGKMLEEGLQDWLDGRIKFKAENNCK